MATVVIVAVRAFYAVGPVATFATLAIDTTLTTPATITALATVANCCHRFPCFRRSSGARQERSFLELEHMRCTLQVSKLGYKYKEGTYST